MKKKNVTHLDDSEIPHFRIRNQPTQFSGDNDSSSKRKAQS